MKFNVQRVLTPAYLTSVALVVVGVVLGLAWYPVAAWLFVLAGLALNAMAVSVTEINDAPRRRPALAPHDDRGGDGELVEDRAEDLGDTLPPEEAARRAPVEPDAETAATPTVPHSGSSPLRERR
ncbi:hypothetical protein [Kocuria rosea]|uniref:Uncharacterized protein n=1 Tax=Kocuria rosea TaxID=1275 RepID=A0A4V3B3E2_KOCRO|nr:hypothetical protein [Kocuria rosea]TDL44510.1 hypothetical protein E2R59_05350 [Kocuria rosea]